MKVKMLCGLIGPGVDVKPGEEYECSAAEGKMLIEQGSAVPVKTERKKATAEKRETR
jgi:hypothetical protein